MTSLLNSYNLKKADTNDTVGDLDPNFDKDDAANAGMKAYCTNITNIELKSCKKDMEDEAWESTSKDKEKFSKIQSDVEQLLQAGDAKLKTFKKAADDADKTCKTQAGDVSKIKNGKAASRYSSVATAFSKIVSTANGAAMSIYKEQLSQARSVYAKAVQYKPKY